MSANRSILAAIGHDVRGEAAVSFGLMLPVLIALTFGVLEFGLVTFDFHRATEAARRGARTAAIGDAVTNVSGLGAGGTIVCNSSGGSVTCSGGGGSQPAFDAVVAKMQGILPTLVPSNVRITYRNSGIGAPDTPGGILPMVTVELVDVSHKYLVLQVIPGISSSFVFPPFTSNYLAGGQGPSA